MSLQGKAQRLFEYISQIYAIDLPIDRDVTKYGAELWWQANIIQSSQCEIKDFNEGIGNSELDEPSELSGEDTWLSVTKRSYESPPELPSILKEWVNLSPNPTKRPLSKSSKVRLIVEVSG